MIVQASIGGIAITIEDDAALAEFTPEQVEDFAHRAGRQAVATWQMLPDAETAIPEAE